LLLLDMSLRRQAVTSAFARDVTAGATIVMTLSQAHHIRPQLFSLLFFSVLLACLLATRRGSLRTLLILPPLFGVWANFMADGSSVVRCSSCGRLAFLPAMSADSRSRLHQPAPCRCSQRLPHRTG
jgi:hypothetical protein